MNSGHYISSKKRQEINSLLKQCQSCAVEASCQTAAPASTKSSSSRTRAGGAMPSKFISRHAFVDALKSLYTSLVDLASLNRLPDVFTKESAHPVGGIAENETIDRYRQTIAEFLILELNRVIVSLDEEIDGPFLRDDYLVNESSCKWYSTVLSDAFQIPDNRSDKCVVDEKITIACHEDPEQWIDKCLDLCGLAISLEVAVDCLRKVVHTGNVHKVSFDPGRKLHLNDQTTLEDGKMPCLSAVVTSLRTIRRRLFVIRPQISNGEHSDSLVITSCQLEKIWSQLQDVVDNQNHQLNRLFENIILPVEYYHQSHSAATADNTSLLSESLVALATSVVPALVSSACHAMKLPLPLWASKESNFYVLHSAFRVALAGNIFRQLATRACRHSTKELNFGGEFTVVHEATSNYFQALMRHMILKRTPSVTIRVLYQALTSTDAADARLHFHDNTTILNTDEDAGFTTPRSILRFHFGDVLASIPAKREIASFVREMVQFSISKQRYLLAALPTNYRRKSERADVILKDEIMQILEYFLMPSLSRDIELREAVVNFVILSPPTSFRRQDESTEKTLLSLHVSDLLIPRCTLMLLHVACDNASATPDNSSLSTVSTNHNSADETSFLSHLLTVAAVWCEEFFVTRTDPLQQQYVTEFLLYPLEKQILTQKDMQLSIDGSDVSLAGMLVQGVSSRLEVSRSESIRKDGMRVAEAMASVFGQPLCFEELHPPEDLVESTDASMTDCKKKATKKTKRIRREPKVPVIVDPDAEYFSDDSNSSENHDSSSQSESDNSEGNESMSDDSSWGEASLRPYELDDDEEDLRRVPHPRSLRDCLAYLLTTHDDTVAYDKHRVALQQLPALVSSNPLDLIDVVPTLVRILLHMEDKFNMDGFLENRWESMMACAVQAPIETCSRLIEEMKGNVSLGTRLEALSILACSAEELSGVIRSTKRRHEIKEKENFELAPMSTRLRNSLTLSKHIDDRTVQPKTRRWRRARSSSTSTTNNFNAISAQVILSLFAFLSETKNDDSIWGGSLGERFLCEFLRTLSVMVDCGRTYPSSRLFAMDLFELSWSFHDAKSSEVRRAVLIAMATSISIDCVVRINDVSGLILFLSDCRACTDADCREMASSIAKTITDGRDN
ncbi:hypothetical protein ACHAW6_011587 [Cyclotella cf. meneghiniana]